MKHNNTHKYKKSFPTPAQYMPTTSYYDILNEYAEEDDDDETVVTSNRGKDICSNSTTTISELSDNDQAYEDQSTNNHHQPTEYAILDSGATSHFLLKGAAVKNAHPSKDPLKIKLPDGSFINSTHTCNLDIPWLPKEITEAHIVPGLAHSSLVATRKFCDAGCSIIIEINECLIFYKDKVVLTGARDYSSGLWKVPINPASPTTMPSHSY